MQENEIIIQEENKQEVVKLSRNKNFMLLFFGALATNIGSVLYSFAVSFYILKISENNATIQGTYLAVGGVVYLLFTFVGGVVADRLNNAKILVVCDFVRGSFILLSALVIWFADGNYTAQIIVLFALGIVSNFISAMFSPAAQAIIPKIVPEKQLQKANSLFYMTSSLQAILGIMLASILYSYVDIVLLFVLIGVCYIISGITEVFIRYNFVPNEQKMTIKSSLGEIKASFKYLLTLKGILAMIIACLFVNFFINPIFSNGLPYFVSTDLKSQSFLFDSFMTAEMWSSVVSVCNSVAAVILSIILSTIKPLKRNGRLFKICLLALGIFLTLNAVAYFVFQNNVNAYLISLCFISFTVGAGCTAINIPVTTAMQRIVDKSMYAKVMSLTTIGSIGLTPIASFVGGIIIETFSLSALWWFCGVGFLLTAVIISFNRPLNKI